MDPQDRHRSMLPGVGCSVCDERVPPDRVRLLAWREDLRFIQVDCPACGSTTLGFVAGHPPGEGNPRGAGARPVDVNDVLDMHEFLAGWSGDLAALVSGRGNGAAR